MEVKEDGRKSFFAIMDKSFKDQSNRIKETRAKKIAERKAQQKKAEKLEKQEKIEERIIEKRLEKKKSDKEIITANSMDELLRKIDEYNYNMKADNVQIEDEKKLGSLFDFRG